MATTGWGDESSDDEEGPVFLPVVTEPIQPPPKAVLSSLQQQQQQQQQAGGRGGGRQPSSHVKGGGGGRVERGGGRQAARGAGRQPQHHDDWKIAAKQASILHRTQEQQQPVDGSHWMAQRQKKLHEQKIKDEELRREQKQLQEVESKGRRASQLQALNAAVKTMQQDQPSSSSSLQQAVRGDAAAVPPRRPLPPPKETTSWRERATKDGEKGPPVSPRQLPAPKNKGEHVSPTGRGEGRGNHHPAAEPNTWRQRAAMEVSSDDRLSSKGGGRARHPGRGRGHVSPNATRKPVAVLQKPAADADPSVDSKKPQQKMKVKNMPDGSVVVTKSESQNHVHASQKGADDDGKEKSSSSLQQALHPHETGGREGRGERGGGRDDSGKGRGRDPSSRGRGVKGGRDDSGRGRGERGRGRGAKGRGRDNSSGRGRTERGGGRDS